MSDINDNGTQFEVKYPWGMVVKHLPGKHNQKAHGGMGDETGKIRMPKRKIGKMGTPEEQVDLSKMDGKTLAKTLFGLERDLKKNPNDKSFKSAFDNVVSEIEHRGKIVRQRIERMNLNRNQNKASELKSGWDKSGNYVMHPKGEEKFNKADAEYQAKRTQVSKMLQANLGFSEKAAEKAVNEFESGRWVGISLSINSLRDYD